MVQPRTPRTVQMPAVAVPALPEPALPQPRRRIANDYIASKDGLVTTARRSVAPRPSAKPKPVALEVLDDAFDDPDAAEAPDSLVQMMDGLEGARIVKEAAWPKEMPAVPRPPSVPKMEALSPPPGPLQPPISRITPRPLAPQQILEDFAKFGPAPTSIWQTPGYAFHIRTRKHQLKQELGLYRERRASDVSLYEKALALVDHGAVRRGWMMLGAGGVLGVLVIVIVCMLL